jgi:RND family efflux transporter MFP subunit
MRQRLAYIIPAAILAALIVWRLGVNRSEKSAQVEAASARKKSVPNVQVATAQVRDILHLFQGVAEVEAPADVRIAPKITGRLDYLQVREGDSVTRGEVLARIDPSQAQAAVNQQQAAVESARANVENAQVRYNRYYSLYKQGFVAAQDLDDNRTQLQVAQSALRAAEAQLRNAQSQLSDTILRSPINGFVTARFFDPGSVVTAGQPVVTVQAIRRVFITTSVPEGVNQQVHPGMDAKVEFDAMPGRTFTGKLTQVNTAADPQSRQFLVRAALPNPQNLIRPGMFCRMTLVTKQTRNAVVVPKEAVTTDRKAGGQVVTVVDANSVAHQIPVKTGDSDQTGMQIVEGVKAGDNVVVLSAQPVRDGQTVRIDKSASGRPNAAQPNIVGGGGGIGGAKAPSGGPSAPTYGSSGGGGIGSGGTSMTPGTSGGANRGGTSGGATGGSSAGAASGIGGGGAATSGGISGTSTTSSGASGPGGVQTGVGPSASPGSGSGAAVGTGSGIGGTSGGGGAARSNGAAAGAGAGGR